jgi:hypothetical protein
MGDPDFLYAALDTTACAVPAGRDRKECANATMLLRKSGGSPSTAFIYSLNEQQ